MMWKLLISLLGSILKLFSKKEVRDAARDIMADTQEDSRGDPALRDRLIRRVRQSNDLRSDRGAGEDQEDGS